VDRARDELFSRTAFSGDEHRGIGRRNELNLMHHFAQAGASPDDVAEILFAADLIEQVGVLGLEPGLFPLHQHAIRDIDEHGAPVLASGLRLDHQSTHSGLPSLRRSSNATPPVSATSDRSKASRRRR